MNGKAKIIVDPLSDGLTYCFRRASLCQQERVVSIVTFVDFM